jgi:hypothetical protein
MPDWEVIHTEEKDNIVATLSMLDLRDPVFTVSVGMRQKKNPDQVGRFIQLHNGETSETLREVVSKCEEIAKQLRTEKRQRVEQERSEKRGKNGGPGRTRSRGGLSSLAEEDATRGGHQFTPKAERNRLRRQKKREG